MMRKPRHNANPPGAARPNFLAVLITCSAVGVLVLNFQLEPARAVSRKTPKLPVIMGIAPQMQTPTPKTDGETPSDEGQTAADGGLPGPVCHGRVALLLHLALLEDGIRWLEQRPHYSAVFHKQEWIEDDEGYGEMTEMQTIELKARHQPFSVYMHWLDGDAGREVLFINGQNDNKMTVHAGGNGLKSKLTLNLDPLGDLAMGEARHPVTQAGLLNLAKTMVEFRRRDLAASEDHVECCMGPEQLFNNRPCYHFTLNFKNEELEPDYRKSVVLIDKEWSIPLLVQNFGWFPGDEKEMAELSPAELDEETFLEYYAFSNVNFETKLSNKDFDKSNPDYRF